MKNITEFIVSEKKQNWATAMENVPEGYRMPSQKELMLMYCLNDEAKFDLPKGNVWSGTQFFLKNGESTSAFATLFTNGYTATVKKDLKLFTIYVK